MARIVAPLVLLLFAVVGTIGADHGQTGHRGLDALAFVLVAAPPVALLWFPRWPVPVTWVVIGLTLAYLGRDYVYGPGLVSAVVVLFAGVVTGHRLTAWAAFLVLYLGHFAERSWLIHERTTLGLLLGIFAWGLLVLILGETARVRRERVLAAVAVRRESHRREANEERLRIARELHDVVAHHMSLINVQAGVALHLVDRQPDQVEIALSVIKDASHEALAELRSLVRVLRDEAIEAPREPTRMLGALDELVERSALGGLTVTQHRTGDGPPLPAAVDLAAYRIVQEAITNVIRHAHAHAADIALDQQSDRLQVSIDDDGVGAPGVTAPSSATRSGAFDFEGSGIRGMRERAVALGGSLGVEPSPLGGLRVIATLPLEEAP